MVRLLKVPTNKQTQLTLQNIARRRVCRISNWRNVLFFNTHWRIVIFSPGNVGRRKTIVSKRWDENYTDVGRRHLRLWEEVSSLTRGARSGHAGCAPRGRPRSRKAMLLSACSIFPWKFCLKSRLTVTRIARQDSSNSAPRATLFQIDRFQPFRGVSGFGAERRNDLTRTYTSF